jgi:hypothetical protein
MKAMTLYYVVIPIVLMFFYFWDERSEFWLWLIGCQVYIAFCWLIVQVYQKLQDIEKLLKEKKND